MPLNKITWFLPNKIDFKKKKNVTHCFVRLKIFRGKGVFVYPDDIGSKWNKNLEDNTCL